MDIPALPGGDLIAKGLADLRAGVESMAALLVHFGAPRQCSLGLDVLDRRGTPAEHRLYELLAATDPDSAHARYNALIRCLVSSERAAACAG